MSSTRSLIAIAAMISVAPALLVSPATARDDENGDSKKYDAVDQVSDEDWWLFGRTTEQQHFSPLSQINAENAGDLGLAWYSEELVGGGCCGRPIGGRRRGLRERLS